MTNSRRTDPFGNVARIAILLTLSAALTACGSGPGEPEPPTLEWVVHDAANSGLPHDWVTGVEVGPDGTLWIGTFDAGLARLDGTDWAVFTAETSGLPSDGIRDLLVGRDGALWVATGLGLARFDGSSWRVYDRSNSPLVVDHVTAVAEDHDGVIWVGSGNVTEGGLYSLANGIWTAHTAQTSPLPCGIVETILVDESNVKWVGTSQCAGAGGVVRIDGNDWTVFTKDNSALRYNAVESLATDGLGHIWAGSTAQFYLDPDVLQGSLARFDGERWGELLPNASGATSNRVTAVEVDRRGRVWVATSVDGPFLWELAVLDGDSWIVLSELDPAFQNDDVIWNLHEDADGRMWVATGQGLLVVRLEE